MEIKDRIALLSVLPLLFGCSALRFPDLSRDVYETRYGNGDPRTRFVHKDYRISDTLTLRDAKGIRQLQYVIGPRPNWRDIDYTDQGGRKRNMIALGSEMNGFWTYISKNFTQLYEPGKQSYAKLFFWIKPDGTVDHVICVENHLCSMALIQTVVEELEKWKFSPDPAAQTTMLGQQINFTNTSFDNIY